MRQPQRRTLEPVVLEASVCTEQLAVTGTVMGQVQNGVGDLRCGPPKFLMLFCLNPDIDILQRKI